MVEPVRNSVATSMDCFWIESSIRCDTAEVGRYFHIG